MTTRPPNPSAETGVAPPLRIGHGYDLHRLEFEAAGPGLMIGGVGVPAKVRAIAHSDGDVLLHALTDALLGALGEADIGELFPNTDDAHKGRASGEFVDAAMHRVRVRGYTVVNADCSVVLETPRLAPHKSAIRVRLAELLGAPVGCVNVKGKTGEGVGPVGEGRAIEAHVVVLLARV